VRRARRIGWLLLLLGVALLAAWALRLVVTANRLWQQVAQLRAMADASQSLEVATTCDLVRRLHREVVTVRREAGWLAQLAPLLSWLPRVGGNLRAMPHLLELADDLTEGGTWACAALEPAWEAVHGTGGASGISSLAQAGRTLGEHRADLERAAAAVARAQTAWSAVRPGELSPWLADRIGLLGEGLPLLRAGVTMAGAAPDLLGLEGARHYLILAQNEEELRPTGGFISAAGLVTFDQGEITEVTFTDTRYIDDYGHQPYPDAPEPLYTYMGAEIWLFRDANWSPDFPSSARQAAYFYEYGQGVHIDGVVALDQRAVELLVAGLGELRIPDSPVPVTAANVRHYMRAAWGPGPRGADLEWIYGHKDFIGRLAAIILQRIEGEQDSPDWPQMAKALHQALRTRHLFLSIDNAAVAEELARLGWDGAIRDSPGDYLMAVDANLGFNKANPLISQTVSYQVALDTDGKARGEVSLTYVHQGRRTDVSCQHMAAYWGDLTYEALIHTCYYDYLRLYVPAGSTLREATAHPARGEILVRGKPTDGLAVTADGEAGKTVFAQFFVVEYGQTLATRLTYDLPRVARLEAGHWRYSLLVQKQAGKAVTALDLRIGLPPGARLLRANPPPTGVEAETLVYHLKLETDIAVEVTYE